MNIPNLLAENNVRWVDILLKSINLAKEVIINKSNFVLFISIGWLVDVFLKAYQLLLVYFMLKPVTHACDTTCSSDLCAHT